MTRINVVDPKILHKLHLHAEYRELPRIFTAVKKHQDSGRSLSDFQIPDRYTLGTGHVTFFYNKLAYLNGRYNDIVTQLRYLQYQLTYTTPLEIGFPTLAHSKWWGQYTPTPEDVEVNMSRLRERMPDYYG